MREREARSFARAGEGTRLSLRHLRPAPRLLALPAFDMRSTCFYPLHLPKMIQIRNVPAALHRKLKPRAALAGMSLSDYLLAQIRSIAARPTMEEMIARIERLPPVEV